MWPNVRRFALGVLIAVPLFFAQGVQPQAAAIVEFDGSGQVTGLTNLQVVSEIYNIDFVTTNSYNEAFPGGEVFIGISDNIMDAINLLLNNEGAPEISSPEAFWQIRYMIPAGFDILGSGDILVRQAICISNCSNWILGASGLLPPGDTGSNSGWAIPTLASAPVPEPATLAIFGVGLIGLGFMRRRRKV